MTREEILAAAQKCVYPMTAPGTATGGCHAGSKKQAIFAGESP